MSDGPILQRFLESRDTSDPTRELPPEDCGSYSWLRGPRERAVMLELRRKDGRIRAVGYGWLERAEYDPAEGITLHIAGQKIQIKGRNLNTESRSLFEGITRHRVAWISESSRADDLRTISDLTVVERIDWN